MTASEDFTKLKQDLRERDELRAKPDVSLTLATRKSEYEARKDALEADAAPHEDGGEDREDFVLEEALAVLHDLVELTARK